MGSKAAALRYRHDAASVVPSRAASRGNGQHAAAGRDGLWRGNDRGLAQDVSGLPSDVCVRSTARRPIPRESTPAGPSQISNPGSGPACRSTGLYLVWPMFWDAWAGRTVREATKGRESNASTRAKAMSSMHTAPDASESATEGGSRTSTGVPSRCFVPGVRRAVPVLPRRQTYASARAESAWGDPNAAQARGPAPTQAEPARSPRPRRWR